MQFGKFTVLIFCFRQKIGRFSFSRICLNTMEIEKNRIFDLTMEFQVF